MNFPVELSGVVYLGYVLGEGEHLRAAGRRVNGIVDEIESSFVERAPLRMSQSLWAWDLHARVHDEYPAAVLPTLSAGAERAVELRQARGLRALLGPAAGAQAPYALLLLLFGRSEMRARRLQARLVYARSLALSLELGCRGTVVSEFAALADEDSPRGRAFAAESVTAAIVGALRSFGVEGIPSAGAARRLRGALWRRGDGDGSEPERGDDDDDDDDESDHENDGGGGSPADADGDDDSDGDGDGGDGDDDDADGADADEFSFLELGGGARAHGAQMRSLVQPLARARLGASVTPAALPSAELWRAVQPSRAWLDATVLAGGASEAAAAFPALLCGVWWIALQVRGASFAPRACGACGCVVHDLDVHLVLGGVRGGAPCSCPRAAVVRAEFFRRVAALFVAHGLAGAVPVGPRGPQTRDALARALGGRGASRVPLPRALARALPLVFVETFGAFAADERARRAMAAVAAAAAAAPM